MEARIQSYLRFAAAHGRDSERIGPFLATFDRYDDNPYRNYALPDDGTHPSPTEVAALVAAAERRQRRPRLEYIPALAPAVEAALLAAGFAVETRCPLMVCRPGDLQPLPVPEGTELGIAATAAELLDLLAVQHEVYGSPAPPGDQDLARMLEACDAGAIAVLARDAATGEAVGAGIYSVPGHGTTEVAGIAVREPYRRRGIAGALTVRLVEEALAAGITLPFLMAAHEEGTRVYARAGFQRIGEVLHISRPARP